MTPIIELIRRCVSKIIKGDIQKWFLKKAYEKSYGWFLIDRELVFNARSLRFCEFKRCFQFTHHHKKGLNNFTFSVAILLDRREILGQAN